MSGDPKTTRQLDKVMSQLDSDGQAQLSELVSRFASGGRKKGRIDEAEAYREQNPWHDTPREKPVFSLAEPLPRKVGNDQEGTVPESRAKDRPVFSLGEPLPHQVRKVQRVATGSKQHAEDDVEQGLRKRPQKDQRDETSPDSDESADTGETLQGSNTRRQSTSSWKTQKTHRGSQDQGTDAAQQFRVDGDQVGGAPNTAAVEEGRADPNMMRNKWARIRAKYPEPLAEFLCTTMSVFLGITGTLSVNLSQNQSKQYGSYETLCWAWGFAFMFGIYLGGGVSGAHMNPAISISLSIFRGFPWRRCAVYVVIQIIGAFAGAALSYAIYADAIAYVDPTMTETYSNFFTVPQTWVSPASAFFTEFLGGAVIMIAVLSLGDDQNNPPGAGMHAFILGLLVTVLKMTLGYNTGAALSPSSDLGPRMLAQAVGYQTDDLWSTGWWAYGPWAGTLSGAVTGCTLYDAIIFIGSESPINYRWSHEKDIWKLLFRKREKVW
ncbi:hypothetical protein N0V82_000388 [Gnomoniopsis sp. IMI 355080]|nr:hypothetical protein N0V82_000388 [Gnomoniopsis sp. IMI 355080]